MLYVLKLGNEKYVKNVKQRQIQITPDLGQAHVFRSKSPASYWVNLLNSYQEIAAQLENINTIGNESTGYIKHVLSRNRELEGIFPEEIIRHGLTAQKVGIIELHD